MLHDSLSNCLILYQAWSLLKPHCEHFRQENVKVSQTRGLWSYEKLKCVLKTLFERKIHATCHSGILRLGEPFDCDGSWSNLYIMNPLKFENSFWRNNSVKSFQDKLYNVLPEKTHLKWVSLERCTLRLLSYYATIIVPTL